MKINNMNQLLVDYCQRFSNPNQPKPVFNSFFTNLEIQNHWKNLPYLHDIQNFCVRLHLAFLQNQKICIYSDYDTDAVTATGVMYNGLLDLGFPKENIEFYAPDRFTEGYGMNTEAVKELCQKFDLIISVDCGINSTLEAEIVLENNLNNEHKCDLMITDHHHSRGDIPNCLSVVNCRMGEVYNSLQKNPQINLDIVSKLQKILEKSSQKTQVLQLQNWLKKSFLSFEQYEKFPEKFLSQSVTGVGVSWFCLVWYAYFVDYLELNS
jgi:DHH family